MAARTSARLLDLTVPYAREDIVLAGSTAQVELGAALLAAPAKRSMSETPTVTLQIADQDHDLLKNSELLGRERLKGGVSIEIGDVDLVLCELEKTDVGEDLTFYPRQVWDLIRRRKRARASRDASTAAQFLDGLCRQAGVELVSPEKNRIQPIAELEDEDRKALRAARKDARVKDTERERKAAGALDKTDKTLKIKGKTATRQQRRICEGVLAACDAAGASGAVKIATIACIIQESVAGALINATPDGDGADDSGIFRQGRNWISLAGSKQPGPATRAFLITGPSSWKKVHGSLDVVPGGLEAAVKKVQISVGGYSQWHDEAKRIVEAWSGGDLQDARTGVDDRAYVEKYEFEVEDDEDWWETGTRIAEERRWRWFWSNGRMVYASDLTLARARATVKIVEGTDGVERVRWLWTVRNRIDDVTCDVRLHRWQAPPGAVAIVEGEGEAADGRYLVRDVERDLIDPSCEGTVTLGRPQDPLPEPASTVSTTPGSDPASIAARAGGAGGEKKKGAIPGSPVPGQPPRAATHPTGGLPGYPAFDYMAPAGTPCVAPVDGKIDRLSGRDPSAGGPAGGALGYSIYMSGGGKSYFLTHLDKVLVKAGQRVSQGEQIAEIANGPRSWSTPHVHMGVRG